jgi:outer membrane protein assembly factor BamB
MSNTSFTMISHLFSSRRWATVWLALTLTAASAFGASKQLWTAKLPDDAKWHSLTGLGTLIVGTDGAILAFDPENGQQLWKREEFKKTSPFNAREIPGTPFLICNTTGGIGGLSKTTFFAVDFMTGQNAWQTPELQGQYLGTVPVPAKGLVLFIVNGNGPDGKDPATYIHAHDLSDGKPKWSLRLAKIGAIRLHIADNSGKFIPSTNLSGYHDPVVEGDVIYLPYLGCTAVDLNTGALKWSAEMNGSGNELKKANAPLLIQGERIYGSAGGSVYCLDKATGTVVWKSERISAYAGLLKARDNALVSQLEIAGGKVWARFGGNFSTGQAVVLREPLGIVALDPASGEAVYHFDKAKEGLTNLLVLPETNSVMFADAANLYGIDVSGATPAESFTVPIEFKRKMGGADAAKIGLGLTGGLMGVAKAAVSSSKARFDVPVAVLRQNGHIIVQGKQHLLGFDPAAKAEKWSLFYGAPSETFANIAMFAVTAAASLAGNAQVAQNGSVLTSGGRQGMENIQSALDRYNRYTEKRGQQLAQASSTDAYTYILTKVGKGDIGLYGVNLTSGETDRELVLGEKEPDYLADERAGRIFHFKGKDSIVAYQF